MTDARWEELAVAVTGRHDDVVRGRMFGMPCLKRGGKVVAGYWKDGGITVKLVDESARERALSLDGVELFDPGMGRVMREWVHVPATRVRDWEPLVEQALA